MLRVNVCVRFAVGWPNWTKNLLKLFSVLFFKGKYSLMANTLPLLVEVGYTVYLYLIGVSLMMAQCGYIPHWPYLGRMPMLLAMALRLR